MSEMLKINTTLTSLNLERVDDKREMTMKSRKGLLLDDRQYVWK
mgnify:CR=1 FL=1